MKSEEKTRAAQVDLEQIVKPPDIIDVVENACPRCNYANEAGAVFCEECGNSLQIKTPCRFCGTLMFGKYNICEFCGEWLLEGKCRFCEFDIEKGQLFCSNCGNMLTTIHCPVCGEKSGFEICILCGTPLTPAAEKILVKHAVVSKNVNEQTSDNKSSTCIEPKIIPHNAEVEDLRKLKTYRQNSPTSTFPYEKKQKGARGLFNEKQRISIDRLGEETEIEQQSQEKERQRLEEESKRKEEEVRRLKETEERKRQEELKKLLMTRAEGTLYMQSLDVTINVKNEDGIDDDKFWLWVNNSQVGYIGYNTGGNVSYPVQFQEGANQVELRFDKASGEGTAASIRIDPNGQKMRFGGSKNHLWIVIV